MILNKVFSVNHRSKHSSATPLSLENMMISDDDEDFVRPPTKRTKKSPTRFHLNDDSTGKDRAASPVIEGPKRNQRPVQPSINAFTVVNDFIKL